MDLDSSSRFFSRRGNFRVLVIVSILGGVVAASTSSLAEESAPSVEDGNRPNIVLFLIDTLRADRLGAYGYDKPTSPNIDALSTQSVRFARADAAAPWTLPSIVSMMTSTYPVVHNVLNDGGTVDSSRTTLAEALKGLGYSTTSFYANQYAGEASGMARGFDHAKLVLQTNGHSVRNYIETLDRDRPFFLYIHNVEPHNPFELHVSKKFVAPFGEVTYSNRLKMLDLYAAYRGSTLAPGANGKDKSPLQADLLKELYALHDSTISVLYDASVRLADKMVGEVISELKAAGLWENTYFILVSDHGEEMGEHGGWQHDQSVYPELVHVPFLLRFPGNRLAGKVIEEPVTLVDVMPTVLDCLGELESDHGLEGHTLLPLIKDEADVPSLNEVPIRFTAQRVNLKKHYGPFKEGRGDLNLTMHRGSWKAIWNAELDTIELYDVDKDPKNHKDLAEAHPDLVDEFRAAVLNRFGKLELAQFQGKTGTWELSPEQIENLKTLGYLE